MQILIDNTDIKDFGVTCYEYTGLLGIASERENERIWNDKSGVDRNLSNIRADAKDFSISCYTKASNEIEAYKLARTLSDYMYSKGVFVLSLRDTGVRECYLCERSGAITPTVHIRQQNGLYVFKLGLRDVNPRAIKYYTEVTDVGGSNTASVTYTKGQTAPIYWGNGDRAEVSNSGTYTKTDFTELGLVDVVIDVDKDDENVDALISNFVADETNPFKHDSIQFTDLSEGDVFIWNWDFGDGTTSDEQNPEHTYTEAGEYTVTLYVYNTVNGMAYTTKTDYIVVKNARLLINGTDSFKINTSDTLLKN